MCDDIYYTLIATIDGQIQASHWADFSMGLGERKVGLSKIASAIEQMARR